MAAESLGRHCVACHKLKKGCDGANPCEYCSHKGIACVEYIRKKVKRATLQNEMGEHGEMRRRGQANKRRKTGHTPGRLPRRHKPGEAEEVLEENMQETPMIFEDTRWTLRAKLNYTQHVKYSCCTKILTTLWLVDEDGEAVKIGELKSAIINKTDDTWILELLNPKSCSRALLSKHEVGGRARVGEMRRVLQMIFDEQGHVRDIEELQRDIYHLTGDKIHYVSVFKLEPALRSAGLGVAAMTLYHKALTSGQGNLPFEGYSVLSPAALIDEYETYEKRVIAAGGMPKSYLQVEDALINFYAKMLYYTLVLGDRKQDARAITVVARPITEELARLELDLLKERMKARLPLQDAVLATRDEDTSVERIRRAHGRVVARLVRTAEAERQYHVEMKDFGDTVDTVTSADSFKDIDGGADVSQLQDLVNHLKSARSISMQQIFQRLNLSVTQLRDLQNHIQSGRAQRTAALIRQGMLKLRRPPRNATTNSQNQERDAEKDASAQTYTQSDAGRQIAQALETFSMSTTPPPKMPSERERASMVLQSRTGDGTDGEDITVVEPEGQVEGTAVVIADSGTAVAERDTGEQGEQIDGPTGGVQLEEGDKGA
ncbi:hypothetical protein CLAFUW4_10631 [Fulvia fulva]|uniref:Zn(2)-C6 fungal-type domain-containing protein n=1 Tax=Passalora fulva TaxID=5499 RepID=A0A9Q8P7M5_PASFU|nr:uncharacterized protein CLAFUR5_05244 [Fulvia fulva]KAK4615535.1 hypothetical protein CLAFUR4_10636 [Fulvia fulva]KAK4617375.1 hypothetical protein CLAFUR0_10608 [Fulvia fulva]UJO16274.1 hypothetical protein CLAFUR5_05244 [Fulvia fulva]WPV18898.1 hypothetical protein CLAFUW4_10631 [Fulvia fulva]WPV34496.1 hypothetical protein CLAFUW7_10633 [Fulvia fulva]